MGFKKFILSSTAIFLAHSVVFAVEVKIDSYGHVGALYNQGFQGSSTSVIGLSARGGANFYFDNGLSLGLAAVGAWAGYDANSKNAPLGGFTTGQYPNTGDVASAFIGYRGNNISFYAGRYSASFLDFDWLSGASTQGIGFKYDKLTKGGVVNKLDLWLTYFNSVLITGYQPGRIGSELGTMYAYHPEGNRIVGGSKAHVVAGGVNMNIAGFVLDPYVLVNTGINNNSVLLQTGAKFGYIVNFAKAWKSSTLVRAMFQYAPNYSSEDIGILAWVDQEFKYNNWLEFGIGGYFVGGQDIWAINDNSRFYGRWVNDYRTSYFSKDLFAGYLFGSFDLLSDRLGMDIMLAYGRYTELSAVIRGTTWQKASMKAEVGGGYVYSSTKNNNKNIGNNISTGGHLLVFTKLSY